MWYFYCQPRSTETMTYRLTIIFVSLSNTHIIWVTASTEPMYESGRFSTCSNCESCSCQPSIHQSEGKLAFWYISLADLALPVVLTTGEFSTSDLPLSDALGFALTGVAAKSLSSTSDIESLGAFFLDARGCFLVAGAFLIAGACVGSARTLTTRKMESQRKEVYLRGFG
jgi:hypothetical protein